MMGKIDFCLPLDPPYPKSYEPKTTLHVPNMETGGKDTAEGGKGGAICDWKFFSPGDFLLSLFREKQVE